MEYGNSARVFLKGGFRVVKKKRRVVFNTLQVVSAPGKPAWVKSKVAGRTINLFRVQGGKRTFDSESGELSRVGQARLTNAAAKILNNRLRLSKRSKLRTGTVWGYFNLYALYKVTQPEETPTGKPPVVAPVKEQPAGAVSITNAATVKWFVRDTFIEYVSSGVKPGDGIHADSGAIGDPASGTKKLVYSYNFPFMNGWTVPAEGSTPENTLIKGQGRVGFRYCLNTINFTSSDPEIEIDGDANSRVIFRVNGTDGTLFPNERAVMVKLIPSLAQSHTTVDNGDGTTTVSYEKIPGFIPAESTGIFAGYYPAYDPGFSVVNPRPDRFGHVSVTYTFSSGSN